MTVTTIELLFDTWSMINVVWNDRLLTSGWGHEM